MRSFISSAVGLQGGFVCVVPETALWPISRSFLCFEEIIWLLSYDTEMSEDINSQF